MEVPFYLVHLVSSLLFTGAGIHNLATIGVVLNSMKILVKGKKRLATVCNFLHDIPGRLQIGDSVVA